MVLFEVDFAGETKPEPERIEVKVPIRTLVYACPFGSCEYEGKARAHLASHIRKAHPGLMSKARIGVKLER